ncbi:MAG: hypothetical protein A2079_08375 [Geobacteraceae bacterium GWC2_48_7]|nr:MAG: hypothetical protein A2079_08375 [Geobacteraceae bacterium GWC2_48_7]
MTVKPGFRYSLLYVEDETDAREMIGATLKAEYPEIQLYLAKNGAEGLAFYLEQKPDLILTDIRMPVMDGIKMAAEIKSIDNEIPIIAVTAYSEIEYLLKAIEIGFSHYVLKPVDYKKLFEAVDKVITILNLKREVVAQHAEILQLAESLEKRVEERTVQLQRLNRLYSLLSETGKAVINSSTREELFNAICKITIEYGGFRRACLGMFDWKTGMITRMAYADAAGFNNAESKKACLCFNEKLDQSSQVAKSLRQGLYYVSNDCNVDPAFSSLNCRGSVCGLKSTAIFSLKINGEPVGAFSISAGETDFFDHQTVELLQQMGDDISLALENLDKDSKRRKVEKELQQEIVEKLHAVEELRLKEQLLFQRSRQAAMADLLVNISHHWRQPLNMLGLLVQELSFGYAGSDEGKMHIDSTVDKVMKLILQMSKTIDDFTGLFEIEEQRTQFSLKESVLKAISLLQEGLTDNGLRLEIEEIEHDLMLNGFFNEYSQIMLIILMNARDVLRERKIVDAKIVVRLFKEEGKTVVTISDNAGGIPEEKLHMVFDPYFSTKGPDKGRGLGLYLARNIIEKNMHGSLTVTNKGGGAEFRIEV